MRSVACLTWLQADSFADALLGLGYEAHTVADSRGRPTLLTDAGEEDLDAVILDTRW